MVFRQLQNLEGVWQRRLVDDLDRGAVFRQPDGAVGSAVYFHMSAWRNTAARRSQRRVSVSAHYGTGAQQPETQPSPVGHGPESHGKPQVWAPSHSWQVHSGGKSSTVLAKQSSHVSHGL